MDWMLIKCMPLLCLLFCLELSAQIPIQELESEAKFCHQFDSHSPFGICEDHFHSKNSLMVNYKFMPMAMSGLMSGTEELSTSAVHESYMVAPLDMSMNMHMYGIMYGVTDRLTVMLMGNYIQNSMDLQMRNGMEFTTQSSGIADHSLSGLYALKSTEKMSFHMIAGISLPIGDIEQNDKTPMADNTPLAYPMQLGSGTWDPYLGINYLHNLNALFLGTQIRYKTRIGNNSMDYSLGDEFKMNIWLSKVVFDNTSISARIQYSSSGEIEGANPLFNPAMMPLFDTANSSRDQMDISLGTNIKLLPNKANAFDLGIEFGIPVYQDVKGIQMKNSYFGTVGIRYTISNKSCH